MLIRSMIECLLHKPFWADFCRDPVAFFNRLVTMDETLIHIRVYDPEIKEQSKDWRHSGSSRPKKFKTQKSSSKMLASVFWDKNGILLVHYLGKGVTITAKYALRCTSRQTEAATGLETSRQSFERNLVSSRQCCSSHGGHYAPETGGSSL
jgi:hypothetical protein